MMIKAEKMTRERYVDIAKGIAILCIALLHYENGIFPQQLNTFIGSFMVSMFYVASGWISALYPKQLGFKDFLRNSRKFQKSLK